LNSVNYFSESCAESVFKLSFKRRKQEFLWTNSDCVCITRLDKALKSENDDNKFTVYTKPCANKQFYNGGSTSNQTGEQNQRLLVKKTHGYLY
jgi:hypothetical protein